MLYKNTAIVDYTYFMLPAVPKSLNHPLKETEDDVTKGRCDFHSRTTAKAMSSVSIHTGLRAL